MLRSTAAANATNAAASSVHATCCTPTSTSGLLHLPSPSTVDDITNPRYNKCAHDPDPDADPRSDPYPDPDADPEPDPRSKLLFGLVIGVGPVVTSILSFPPVFALILELASGTESMLPSGIRSKRYPRWSPSRHASSRPHGFQVALPGRRMSQAPGLDLLTRLVPGDGTNGVTMEAAATGDPERSWMVIDHPFRSLTGRSSSDLTGVKQLADVLGSDNPDLV
ncbi:hypothetical protein CASFOL_042466 [Castilleja foliolosa]|uniref:Uncharacterized protein n=1 Tax=Castilleja foliolosa TaxID=1961234 RepID=A0ABD3BAU8_9LAMI